MKNKSLRLFAFFLVLYEFTTYSSNDMIMPGMLKVINEFKAPYSFVASSFSAFVLGNSCIQLFLGPLAERFSRRKVILLGSFFFLVVTLLTAASINIWQFLLGRLLQGIGLAFTAVGYAIIHESFNDKDAVKMISLMANVALLAPLIAPAIGVVIISHYSWQDIFFIAGFMGLIALLGLYKFTPANQVITKCFGLKNILTTYKQVIFHANFLHGTSCVIVASFPLLIWIAFAPTMIMHTYHLQLKHYLFYQVVAFSGLVLSSMLMQNFAGKVSFYRLITRGSLLSFLGVLMAFMFHTHLNIVVCGIFIYTLGLGIFNGPLTRILMGDKNLPRSFVASAMVFMQSICSFTALEVVNTVCSYMHFSFLSFTGACMLSAISFLPLIWCFAKRNRDKAWE